ncbi:hypothetical protein EDB84DRAFT_1439409 [Lactarius hengduanensis]|nr:hypothetical protein EDB84DRAFT_1439409 [Lactarius hengduanensis]
MTLVKQLPALHPRGRDEAQPLNKGVRDHGGAIRRGTRLSASPGPATPQLRVQRLTRSQTLAASSRNKQPGSSSSQASTIPTGNSHQNKDVPDNANAIQEILDSAGLRVQRLTRSQMLAASSRNEQPGSSSSQASTIPTGNSHQNKDVPDNANAIQEILDSAGLRVQRLTRSQMLAASSRNEQPGSSSSQASTIPTGNSHQNEDIPDDGNTIQEILDSGGLRVQRLTRSQTASSEQPERAAWELKQPSFDYPHRQLTPKMVANDVPDDADTIQEILDSTGLIPYQETNEEAFPSDGEDINNVVKQLKQEIQQSEK